MINHIRQLSTAFAAAFAVVVLAAGYWGVVRSEGLLARGDNPRRVLDERRTARGTIYDRNDEVLAESAGEPGALVRRYPYPALAPVLGYVSPVYGLAGVEAALDETLHGGEGVDAFDALWQGTVLGLPPTGRAVRLTLELNLQRAADEALAARAGAVVVLDIRTGHLLALASHPTYDANALESTWADLVADPNAPLLSRATLGLYQPGGALWPLTLAAAAEADPGRLGDDFASAGQAGSLDEQALACRLAPGRDHVTLRESLLFGCPAPIAALGEALGAERLGATFEAFQLFAAPSLAIPTTAAGSLPVTDPRLAAIGQDRWAWTPLRLALALGAIAGDGTMPVPQLILATQGLNGIWRPETPAGQAVRALTPEAASLVKELLPSGYSALAHTGTEGQVLAWYLDYAPREATRYVVVVLLEDGDTEAAVAIGQSLLAAVQAAQR